MYEVVVHNCIALELGLRGHNIKRRKNDFVLEADVHSTNSTKHCLDVLCDDSCNALNSCCAYVSIAWQCNVYVCVQPRQHNQVQVHAQQIINCPKKPATMLLLPLGLHVFLQFYFLYV